MVYDLLYNVYFIENLIKLYKLFSEKALRHTNILTCLMTERMLMNLSNFQVIKEPAK